MPNTDTTRTRATAHKPGAPRSQRLLLSLLGTIIAVLAFAPCSALALNPERHYEMVSPVFKDGFGTISIQAVAPKGESVAYFSAGAFNGIPTGLSESSTALIDYFARRGASGWSTTPLLPPASLVTSAGQVDVSPSLETEFLIGKPGPDSQNYLPAEDLFVHPTGLADTLADWEPIGVLEEEAKHLFTLQEVAASPDFCHVLIESGSAALLKEAQGTVSQVYEFDRGCHGEQASLALVGVNNKDKLIEHGCEMGIGTGPYGLLGNGLSTFNAISSDGGEVFFTDCVSGGASSHQLFARLGGSQTIEVSRPLAPACEAGGVAGEVPCAGAPERASAEFDGASEDGSRVFFTAPLNTGQAPLVPGDADASSNLYLASIGCPHGGSECPAAEREVVSLADVSHDPNGGAADVRGVVRVAPDGQRTYFVAGGDLLSAAQQAALEVQGRPVPRVGADNLYVYDATGAGTVAFIGDLCYGAELSGSVEDTHCPFTLTDVPEPILGINDTRLWLGSEGSEAQTAGEDGRFLVFTTYARLTGDDTNSAKDVYRYDALTGSLERVSIGENGNDSNGNGGLFGSSILPGYFRGDTISPVRDQHELNKRAVSEDGSRIVFSSAEPLSPAATNGLSNAYEWHENAGGVGGAVSLISSGNGSEDPVSDVVISAEGDDVFFITSQGLVAQDIDGAPDIYDARIGGGFAMVPAETRPCEGDGCQGPLTNPAPLLVAGSVVQAPGQNVAPPPVLVATKTKAKPKCKRGFSREKTGKCVKVKRKAHKSTAMHRANSKPSGGGKS
jgi:hypothetical protein